MFLLPHMTGQTQSEALFQDSISLVIVVLKGSKSDLRFCKSGETEPCGMQCPRLYVTFHKAEYSQVATAAYSAAAGDRGGKCL